MYPRRRRPVRMPTPADWGIGMTVCVAGIANGLTEIILAADRRLVYGQIMADGLALKIRPFARRWVASFAGDDIGHVRALLEHVQNGVGDNIDPTRQQVAAWFRSAFAIHRRTLIQEQVLASLGIDVKEFWDNGLKKLGRVAFEELRYRASEVRIGVTFLVAGFNDDDQPHIFIISDEGLSYRTEVGYWAIGSGSNAALSSLAYRRMNPTLKSHEALYVVLESKFMAEGPYVGPETVTLVQGVDGSLRVLDDNDLATIRTIWEKEGRAPMPKNLGRIPLGRAMPRRLQAKS